MAVRGARDGAAGRWLGALRPPLVCLSLLLADAAGAQVVLDASLGPAGPAPFDGVTWHVTDDLGTPSGGNLFHSLSQLDVPAGLAVSFHLLDPASPMPQWVFARVPDGRSMIDGTIGSAYPNLILLNPNGFSFGPQSAVQAQGSLYLSSADVLRFGADEPFDARSDETPALLSADPPTAFGFLSDAPASIVFNLDAQDTGFDSLPVARGATFAVVGGDIRIDGWSASSGDSPTIRIEGGNVELAAVQAAGTDVPVDVASFDARGQASSALGEVALGRNALIQVGSESDAFGSGRVVIRGGRIVVDEAAGIEVIGGLSVPGKPIAIDLEAAESVEVGAGSRFFVLSADVPAGDLRISAESVAITGASTQLIAFGSGKAPELHVEAESAVIDGAAEIKSFALGAATGGTIAFDVSELRVTGGASLQSESAAAGSGGSIEVEADSFVVGSGGQLLSHAGAEGAGGRISIIADSATLTGASEIRSHSDADGPGGAIDVAVGDLRVDTQGQIVSENTGPGAGGAIDVSAEREVSVASRGKILSQATGAASNAGGDVTVDAGVRILVVGEDSTDADVSQLSALTSSSSPDGSGGSLRVSAPTIELRDAGQLRTTTTGAGKGGTLDVVDTDLLLVVGNATVDGELAGAGLFARTSASDAPVAAAGDGGDLTIAARMVQVEDGGEVSARTFADGDAGDLEISGAESVTVRGGPRGVSTLSSRGAQGAGGDLAIDADRVELASGGLVSASTVGAGDAGNIFVTADTLSISGAPSGLFSQTTFPTDDSGAAGNIVVAVAKSLEVRDGGRISVDSGGGGAAGEVFITGGPGASVALVGGNVSARSRRSAEAGNVTISTGGDFVAGRGSSVVTQAEGNASGGRVAISAKGIFYASDALIETRVDSGGAAGALGDGGNVDIPPPAAPGTAETPPVFAVLNRSSIIATAIDGNGGNIRVAARDLLASQGVVIDATSQRGVPGEVEITSPDEALAGQITPLPSNFLDASKLMSTACDARRERTGSFVVQTREAAQPLPDAPLAPSDISGERAEGPDTGSCPG